MANSNDSPQALMDGHQTESTVNEKKEELDYQKIQSLKQMTQTMERYLITENPVARYHPQSQIVLTDVHVEKVRKCH